MPCTVEQIRDIQQELFCDDVEIPFVGGLESMTPWSEAQVREFFERAGNREQAPAAPTQQDFLAMMQGEEELPPPRESYRNRDEDDDCMPLRMPSPPPAQPRAPKPAAPSSTAAAAPPPPPPKPKFMRPSDFTDTAAPTHAERRKG